MPCAGRDMGMAAEKDISGSVRRRSGLTGVMSMCRVDGLITEQKDRILSHYGEVQDHLVDFRVTIASHAQKIVLQRVQHIDDFFRIIVTWKIITRSVVEYVAEKDDPFGFFLSDALAQPLTVICGAVYV